MSWLEISAVCHAVVGACFILLFSIYFTTLEKAAVYKQRTEIAEESKKETLKMLHQEKMRGIENAEKIYHIGKILNPAKKYKEIDQ